MKPGDSGYGGCVHNANERRAVLALLIIFIVLALIFGIGGAIKVSLWFLLLLVLAVVLAVLAMRALASR